MTLSTTREPPPKKQEGDLLLLPGRTLSTGASLLGELFYVLHRERHNLSPIITCPLAHEPLALAETHEMYSDHPLNSLQRLRIISRRREMQCTRFRRERALTTHRELRIVETKNTTFSLRIPGSRHLVTKVARKLLSITGG